MAYSAGGGGCWLCSSVSPSGGWRQPDPPQGRRACFTRGLWTTVAPRADPSRVTPKPPVPRQTNPPSQAPTTRPPARQRAHALVRYAYWIEWARAHAAPTRIADPARFVFHSGDRIRFHVRDEPGNRLALYVLNRGSRRDHGALSTCQYGRPLRSRPGTAEYTVGPTGAWIVFDDQPGEEGVIFSPLAEPPDAAPGPRAPSARPEPRCGDPADGGGQQPEDQRLAGRDRPHPGPGSYLCRGNAVSASGRPERGLWCGSRHASSTSEKASSQARGCLAPEAGAGAMNRWVVECSPQVEEAFHCRQQPVWSSASRVGPRSSLLALLPYRESLPP